MKIKSKVNEAPKWIGCGECDCSFPCDKGESRCIRLPPIDDELEPDGDVDKTLRLADGSIHQFTIKVDGKPFRCDCGCNVFHHPDRDDLELWQCNGCEIQFRSE